MTVKGQVILKKQCGLEVYIVFINGVQVSSHMSERHAISRMYIELKKYSNS